MSEHEDRSDVRTFLIADIRGYTRFTLEHGDETAVELVDRFVALSREVIAERGGSIFGQQGDQILSVFPSARGAIRSAVQLQERLAREREREPLLTPTVGVGLDAGEAVPVRDDYFGTAVNLAARLCSLAGPGEVLVTETVANLARVIEGLNYVDRGSAELKGFAAPVRVSQVVRLGAPGVEAVQGEPATTAGAAAGAPSLPIGNFLGALPEGVMVAREGETARLLGYVDAVEEGQGRLVLLTGEAGVGKTRLAQEVTLQVRNRGFALAAGRCYEQEGGVPFYPFIDALAMLYAAAPADVRSEVPRRWAQLARLLPGENLSAPPASNEGLEEQDRLFRAVTGFVTSAADRQPVALFLDDLHWADASSLQLLQHVARHTRTSRVLLLGTYRDVEVTRQHPLQAALRDLQREGLVERLDVKRLEESGTAELIRASVGAEGAVPAFAELLHRRTEGNPFFIHQVLRVLRDREEGDSDEAAWSPGALDELEVPESVRAVVEQRLAQLPEEAQELLREASVLGQTFSFDDVLRMTERPEGEIEDALDAAVEMGIIREGGGESYSFNHALTQQALTSELSARKRRRLHLAAGRALSALPALRVRERAAEIAWHFLEGDDPERALPQLLTAADHAGGVFAYDEAQRHLRTAVEIADELGDRARHAEALEMLGRVLQETGRLDEAVERLRAAADDYRRLKDLQGEGRTMARLLATSHVRGPEEEDEARARAVLEDLEKEGPSSALVQLYGEYAGVIASVNRRDEGLAMIGRSASMARDLGDEALTLDAEFRLGAELFRLRRTEEARQVLEAVIPLAERVPSFYGTQARGILGEILKVSGEFEAARRLREDYARWAERTGDVLQIGLAFADLGEIAFLMGDWGVARSRLELALERMRSLNAVHYLPFPALPLADLQIASGDWDGAEALLSTFAGMPHTSPFQAPQAERLLAKLNLERGRAEQALSRLQDCWSPELDDDTGMVLVRTWAELETGREEAEAHLHHLLRLATEHTNRLDHCEAQLLSGTLCSRTDRLEDAGRLLEGALDEARPMPYPYAEARAMYELGRLKTKTGNVSQARERLEEALAIFRRLGARPYIERVGQALAAVQ